MSAVENTSKRDAWVHVLGSLSDGPSNYIEGMEAEGQRQMVQSQQMPTDGPWDELTALGFVQGEPVKGDDLFCDATLPAGWSKQPTDHAMWSSIVDEREVERVAVFYKAAFYDRRAFCRTTNAGYGAATKAIYGDEPAALPASWPLFNDDERAAFTASLNDYAANAQKCPDIYADRMPRVELLLSAVSS